MFLGKYLRFFPQQMKICKQKYPHISRLTTTALLQQRNEVKITISKEGKQLQALWNNSAKQSTYHSVWLRHNCNCPQCLNSSNQNSVLSYELDPKVTIRKATVTDVDVKMKWSCGHDGYINLDWLEKHCYSNHSLETARKNTSPSFIKQNELPTMDSEELEDDYGIWRWLKTLNEYGVCLITNVPCTKEGGLKLTQKICPNLQETMYGGATEVKVDDDPISTAYGSTHLEPHMDIPMYESHPGITILQCLRNDECVTGGESIVVDGLAAVEKFRVKYPQHFATLVRVPATFHRIHFERDNPVKMVYRTPHIHLNGHNEIVKLRWAAHHYGPLQVAEEDVQPYYEAYTRLAKCFQFDCEFQIRHRLQPGETMTLNDHRMLHGRTAINLNGGSRFLHNFCLNIDDFKSRFLVLCTKYDPDYVPKNILNHDFSFSTAARV